MRMAARARYGVAGDDPLDERALAAMGVGPRRRRRRGGALLLARLVGGTLGAAALVGAIALYAPREAPFLSDELVIGGIAARPAPELTAPPAAWRTLARPLVAYGLDATGFSGLAHRHEARASAAGALEDSLVFGAFEEPGTHLRLTLTRFGDASPPAERPFFVDVALTAAQAGLALGRSGQPARHESRFGPLEIAPLALENGPMRSCLAFRGGAPLRLSGWLCAPDAGPAELVCLIDRLVLLDDGGDALLAEAFASARPRCGLDGALAGRAPSDRESLSALAAADLRPLPPPHPSRAP